MKPKITVETTVLAPIEKIWKYWTEPEHIVKWCNASPDWHTPRATNDIKVGGKFFARMESKDGKEGFDFTGTYTIIKEHESIEYQADDGRMVHTAFLKEGEGYRIIETFEAEDENPIEMQKSGWQAILDNFKKYVEDARHE